MAWSSAPGACVHPDRVPTTPRPVRARRQTPVAWAIKPAAWLLAIAVPAIALAFLVGLLRWRLFAGAALQRVAECPRSALNAPALRRTFVEGFDDPTVEIVFPGSGVDGGWMGCRGRVPGRTMIDARVVERLIGARHRAERSPLAELTPRELEILTFVARGHSNQAIADELVLTKRAVEKHINAIFLKLGLSEAMDVSRRVKAALIYLAERDPD